MNKFSEKMVRVVIEVNEVYPVLSITDESDSRFESLIDPARYISGYNPCRELPQFVVDEIKRFADLDQEMHEFLSSVQDGTEAKPPRLVAVPRELLTAAQDCYTFVEEP